MIIALRKKHRAGFGVLAVALPFAFAAAIFFRAQPIAVEGTLPFLQTPATTFPQLIFEKEDLWPGKKITTRIYADRPQPTGLALELHPAVALAQPGVLVYWHENENLDLENAFLLGTLDGTQPRRWVLPPSALEHDGKLVLFSLAHQGVIAQAHLPIRLILQKGGGL